MRRILYYSLVCLLWVSVNSCKDDEASQPPTPTFTVDRTSGLYNSTEFVFTVDQVGANAVSLLPYGADHVNDAGILIPASSFTNGKATVKFVYGQVGTFNAVVVANNHTGDGLSVKSTTSSPTAITITSNRNALLDFSFDHSTKTVIDTVAHTITVTVPAGTDVTNLTAKFTASNFATVTGDTKNFSSPVVYTVTPQNGGTAQTWTVTVNVTPREKTNMFKSFQGLESSTVYKAGRVLPAYIDSANNQVVIYDVAEKDTLDPGNYDSVALDFALKGSFAYAEYGTYSATGPRAHGKDTVDLTDDLKITIVPQDSSLGAPDGPKTFDVYFRIAPKLIVTLTGDPTPLNPIVKDTTTNYGIALDVLANTHVSTLKVDFDFLTPAAPAAATTINAIKADGVTVPMTGASINATKPVKIQVSVTQDGVTFWVTYTLTVNSVK